MPYSPAVHQFPHNAASAYQNPHLYAIHPQSSFKQVTPNHAYPYYAWGHNTAPEPFFFHSGYTENPWAGDTTNQAHPSPSFSEHLAVETNSTVTTSTTQSIHSASSEAESSHPCWSRRPDYPVTALGKARLNARYLDISRIPFASDCEACFCPSSICDDHQLDSVCAEVKGAAWKDKPDILPAFEPSLAVLGHPSESLRVTSIKSAVFRLKAVESLQQMDAIVIDLVMWKDDTRCRRQHLVQFRTHALALFRAVWSPNFKFLPYDDYSSMTENLRSLDSLSFFMSESLEVTRKAHVFAILLGKLLQRNILEPTDIIRASEWLLLYAEHDGFVQGFCALLLSGGDKVMKGDQKKLANTTCLRNVLKIARKKLECHGERYAEYQILLQEASFLIEEYVEIQAQKRLAKLHGQKYKAPN